MHRNYRNRTEVRAANRSIQEVIKATNYYLDALDPEGVLTVTLSSLANAVAKRLGRETEAGVIYSMVSFYVHSRNDLFLTRGSRGGIRRTH